MKYVNEKITPYKGMASFSLGERLEAVRKKLKFNHTPFQQWSEPNKDCTPPIPWENIKIDDCITLTFAKGILFRIYVEKGFLGALPNGVRIGTSMDELSSLDPTLEYNDDDEDFISKAGYWICDNIETNSVSDITVFLPDVENESFFSYEWVSQYL